MDHYPTFESVMDKGSSIKAIRDIQQKCVYAVVNRRQLDDKCVVNLRGSDGKKTEVWATKALKDTMVGGSALSIPIWVAIPDVQPGKFIRIVTTKFDSKDYSAHPWAEEIRAMKIPPVYLPEESEEEQVKPKKRKPKHYPTDSDSDDGNYSRKKSKRISC